MEDYSKENIIHYISEIIALSKNKSQTLSFIASLLCEVTPDLAVDVITGINTPQADHIAGCIQNNYKKL